MINKKGMMLIILSILFGTTSIVAETPKNFTGKYPPFYAAVSCGTRGYGSLDIGTITTGGVSVVDIEAAYFFSQKFGIGVKANMGTTQVEIKNDTQYGYTDRVTFIGPTVNGWFGKKRVVLSVSAGAGTTIWKTSVKEQIPTTNDIYWDNFFTTQKESGIGLFLSAGLYGMITQNFGLGLNLQSLITPSTLGDYNRTPSAVGGAMTAIFRF